jgi:pyridoxamine 5'-phosphate oxidase
MDKDDFLGALSDPIELFERWYDQLQQRYNEIPMRWPKEAMTLSTASREGRPSARMVLLRGFDAQGFVFYTNYQSRKARELDQNPHAALTFWWPFMGRQVRIAGAVAKTSPEESDAYFASRPHGSRIGAWASDQSREIEGPEDLALAVAEVETRFQDRDVPRPPHWGGYKLRPQTIEFWMEGDHRLHQRRFFEREGDIWSSRWLAP